MKISDKGKIIAGRHGRDPGDVPQGATIFRQVFLSGEEWRQRMRPPPELAGVADGIKEFVSWEAFAHRDRGSGTLGIKLGHQRSNQWQAFRAGGSWPSLGAGRIYLNPPVTTHCLAFAGIRQGDHQQKQHDGHSTNEPLVRH